MTRCTSYLISLLLVVCSQARTITVDDDGPADFNNIQAAIEDAATSDTVIVADGLYKGAGNRDLDFDGKLVTVKSQNGPYSCIIDCERQGRGFYFHNGENQSAVVEGLTVTNGRAYRGSGLYCTNNSSPTIINCVIRGNQTTYAGAGAYFDYDTAPVITGCVITGNSASSYGGGVYLTAVASTLANCEISGNSAGTYGGGVYCNGSTLTLTGCSIDKNISRYGGGLECRDSVVVISNCTFGNNSATYAGGAIRCYDSSPTITNCTFAGNRADSYGYGGGIHCRYGSSPLLANCAFSNNTKHAIYEDYDTDVAVQYCLFSDNPDGDYFDNDTSESYTGAWYVNSLPGNSGNIDGDPCFAFAGDLHPVVGSACIDNGTNQPDAGLPATDKDGNPRPLWAGKGRFAIADIGAYEYNLGRPSIAVSSNALEFIREQNAPNPASQTLAIRNCGGGRLQWQVSEDCPWLAAAPGSGESAGEVNEVALSVSTDGMSRGVYTASLTVSDANAVNSPRRVWITLRIKGRLYVPEQYPSINEAIEASMKGETIEVGSGTYRESLDIDKAIEVIGLGRPVIEAPGTGYNVVSLVANHCTIKGFDVVGGATGIVVRSYNNLIRSNRVANNDQGILLSASSGNNTLSDNEIVDNNSRGLYIERSAGNTLRQNTIRGSKVNFDLYATTQEGYEQDADISNTVDGRPIVYLVESDGVVVDSASNAGCVFAVDCTNVVVEGLTLSGNGTGVLFAYTTNSSIEDVTAVGNSREGILLQNSPNNTLTSNTVAENERGIVLYGSPDNNLRNNACADNRYNFVCEGLSDSEYQQDIDISNTVDGKPVYFLVGKHNVIVDGSTNAGCVFAVNCANITIRGLSLSGNGTAIAFVNTSNSEAADVSAAENSIAGVLLVGSTNVAVRGSLIWGNTEGVHVSTSNGVFMESTYVHGNALGVTCRNSSLTMVNSIVANNLEQGGVSFFDQSNGSVVNCTICSNSNTSGYYPYGNGSGIFCDYMSNVTVSNSIVWANQPGQMYSESTGLNCRYSDVQGGYEGTGNIDEDPMLTPDGHLRLGSPCINRGGLFGIYTEQDFDGDCRVYGGVIDIGADEYIDADSDGLPDWYEERHFDPNDPDAEPGADADGDQYTNLEEYELYSSDPTVHCAIYHVDAAQPDDSNDGLSWETAKRTVQAAVELARNSDRILIAQGHYPESISTMGRQISMQSKDPHDPDIVASTVLAGGVSMTNGEMAGCKVSGVTISNPESTGLLCVGSSPTITYCSIANSNSWYSYDYGGGVTCLNGRPTITNCTISGNLCGERGAALLCRDSRLTVANSVICGNVSYYGGQSIAVYAEQTDLTMSNCTISDNSHPEGYYYYGSAIQCSGGRLDIANSILWNNLSWQITGSNGSSVTVSYCDIRGGQQGIQGPWAGVGNISVDPCFVDPGYWSQSPNYGGLWTDGDYHLKSEGWRWMQQTSHNTHWIWDGQTSVCIDAGNPGTLLGDEVAAVPTDPNNEWGVNVRVNLGAYGGTAEASMAPSGWALRADLTNDGTVDFADFAQWAQKLSFGHSECTSDLNRNTAVDFADFALFAEDWLAETRWCGSVLPLPDVILPGPLPPGGRR